MSLSPPDPPPSPPETSSAASPHPVSHASRAKFLTVRTFHNLLDLTYDCLVLLSSRQIESFVVPPQFLVPRPCSGLGLTTPVPSPCSASGERAALDARCRLLAHYISTDDAPPSVSSCLHRCWYKLVVFPLMQTRQPVSPPAFLYPLMSF